MKAAIMARQTGPRVRGLVTVVALMASACGGGGNTTPANDQANPSVLIAFAANFTGFRAWPHFDVTTEAAPGTVHPDAQLIEYINKIPPSGSTTFPVGTIIVKEPTSPSGASETPYFAMVKRGGGFNADGAAGWEWFELQNVLGSQPAEVQLVWRGVGPPAGEVYGGDPNAGCNTCHRDCGNDAVCAKSVSLSVF